jgi:Fur family ferric uptake transcriptional regulator
MKKCDHSDMDQQELVGKLRRSERKLTGPRRAILTVLSAQKHPVTTRQISGLMAGQKCDLATIYRSMHLLERMGLVRRFDFGDGTARFELVRDGEGDHHHHLICTECDFVVEIEDCFPNQLEKRIARSNGFARISHKLEFFGICPECQAK